MLILCFLVINLLNFVKIAYTKSTAELQQLVLLAMFWIIEALFVSMILRIIIWVGTIYFIYGYSHSFWGRGEIYWKMRNFVKDFVEPPLYRVSPTQIKSCRRKINYAPILMKSSQTPFFVILNFLFTWRKRKNFVRIFSESKNCQF